MDNNNNNNNNNSNNNNNNNNNNNKESKLMPMEIDFLRRSARCSRLEKIEIMSLEKKYYKFCFRLYKIQTVELVWPRAKNE